MDERKMERFENNVTGHPTQFHLLSIYLQRYKSSTDQTTDGNPHIIFTKRKRIDQWSKND